MTDRALERDLFMTAEEALKFGIVDKIVQRRPKSGSSSSSVEESESAK